MADSLRLGFAGGGWVAEEYHMPAVRAVPDLWAEMVVDVDAGRAARFAKRHHIERWNTDYRQLIGHVDVVIVALPNSLHAPVACDLLEAGLHVLCEKPMARNVEECRAMILAAERSGKVLCIGHNRRFLPHIALARRLVKRGYIGQVLEVEAEEGGGSAMPLPATHFDLEKAGGGSLIDLGVHAVDLIRWFVAEFSEVSYAGNGTATTIESDAEMRFTLSNGARGRLRTSFRRTLAQKLTFVGSAGRIDVGLWNPQLRMQGTRGKAFESLESLDIAWSRRSFNPSFVHQLLNFVSAVRGREPVHVNGNEGMAAVEVVRRAYGSASTRQPSIGGVLA